jgi:protein-tyrosine-phosphatase/DNA-binding HxlR family transcriptional regulator
MNAERNTLANRARIHAALGDPARLAIVDTLVTGDVAPGELSAVLELSSNLVAHHLKVLESAGLVTRTRSEGDRRRTYVRLAPEALESIAPPSLDAVPRVLFVCTHNSARSQLAAAIWAEQSDVPAASGGTEPADRVNPRAVRVARRHGLDPDSWHTAHIDDVLQHDDLVIAVCDTAYEQLPSKALHWSIPDPSPIGTTAAFESAYTDIAGRIDRLAPALSMRASSW